MQGVLVDQVGSGPLDATVKGFLGSAQMRPNDRHVNQMCSRNGAAPTISALENVLWTVIIHVGLPWPATATLVTPSSWAQASDEVIMTCGDLAMPRLSER